MSAVHASPLFRITGPAGPRANVRHQGAALPPLRLTRRGRLVLLGMPLMLAAVVIVLMAGIFSPQAKAGTLGGASAGYAATVTVMAGQSLWSIAAQADPQRDPRDVVNDILAMNKLASAVLQPGQQLFVPLQQR